MREPGFGVLDLWGSRFETPAPGAEKEVWERFNALVGEENAKAIGSSGDMLAVLDGINVGSGTVSGIGYNFAFGKKLPG